MSEEYVVIIQGSRLYHRPWGKQLQATKAYRLGTKCGLDVATHGLALSLKRIVRDTRRPCEKCYDSH